MLLELWYNPTDMSKLFQDRAIPDQCILGIHYNGLFRSSIALLSLEGEAVFASSLETLTRVEQDGRAPLVLMEDLPWEKISTVAVSTEEFLRKSYTTKSRIHPNELRNAGLVVREHGPEFKKFFDGLPKSKEYVCHHLSLAHAAFWPSGFEEAICLVYGDGVPNSPWFGGFYHASRKGGVEPIDLFPAGHYAKMMTLYSMVTAVLGLTPNRQDGKMIAMAAGGPVNKKCQKILERVFCNEDWNLETAFEWEGIYSAGKSPRFIVKNELLSELSKKLEPFEKEEIAATILGLVTTQIVRMLEGAEKQGLLRSEQICLAGNLFLNSSLNQRIKELGFKKIFIAPFMSDEGAAWGAALAVLAKRSDFNPKPLKHVFLGSQFSTEEIENTLKKQSIQFRKGLMDPREISQFLARGAVVGLFQGAVEFGHCALGNRSILSQATQRRAECLLNQRLGRDAGAPFYPMTRMEDALQCYPLLKGREEGCEHAAEFMTISLTSSTWMAEKTPGVVQGDWTTRPQLIRRDTHPFLHAVLTEYKCMTGLAAVINAPFGMPEGPLVGTPEEAIQVFLKFHLDYLVFLDAQILVSAQPCSL